MQGYGSGKGTLALRVIRAKKAPLSWRIKNALRPSYLWGWFVNLLAKMFTAITQVPTGTAVLRARVIKADGEVIDYGIVSRRVVTNAYANLVVDDLQGAAAAHSTLNYHAIGTDGTAESASDTTLGVEVESRATGTQTEGASANEYETVGTITATASRAVVEHGVFSASTGGTLMDRSVFSVVNLSSGDSFEGTYTYTYNSGS